MSPQPSYYRRRQRRWPRRLFILGALVLIVVVVLGGVGWYYSGQVIDVDHTPAPFRLTVERVGTGTVTLPRTADTARPGVYGLVWADGHAVLGDVAASDAGTVTRRLTDATGRLTAGTKVRLDTDVFTGDPLSALGLRYSDVKVPDPLGPMPAWFVPGTRPTWVVLVHGRNVTRAEALHILPALNRAGFPTLDLSYRNDAGAPQSKDHLLHLGATEWRDVDAGIAYAVAHGAQNVVLYGFSMGGAIVEATLRHASQASRVRAVVLDAPVLNWDATLRFDAAHRSLPLPLTLLAEQVIRYRVGLNFGEFDVVHKPVPVPTLLFHGGADGTVPVGPSDTYARENPNRVQYVRVGAADHVQAWNVDPAAYEKTLVDFLDRIVG